MTLHKLKEMLSLMGIITVTGLSQMFSLRFCGCIDYGCISDRTV